MAAHPQNRQNPDNSIALQSSPLLQFSSPTVSPSSPDSILTMPAFLKDLRRRSRSSFLADNSSSESSKLSSNGTSAQPASSRSSVTLGSLLGSLVSPASASQDRSNGKTMPADGAGAGAAPLPPPGLPRPGLAHTKRYSINVSCRPFPSSSPLAAVLSY